jgi:hypothetical protein
MAVRNVEFTEKGFLIREKRGKEKKMKGSVLWNYLTRARALFKGRTRNAHGTN